MYCVILCGKSGYFLYRCVNQNSYCIVATVERAVGKGQVMSCHVTQYQCVCKARDTLSSRHMSSCDVNGCSWDVRGDLTLNSMKQIHTSVTLLTSRDLGWSSGRLTYQHASQISAVAHIS